MMGQEGSYTEKPISDIGLLRVARTSSYEVPRSIRVEEPRRSLFSRLFRHRERLSVVFEPRPTSTSSKSSSILGFIRKLFRRTPREQPKEEVVEWDPLKFHPQKPQIESGASESSDEQRSAFVVPESRPLPPPKVEKWHVKNSYPSNVAEAVKCFTTKASTNSFQPIKRQPLTPHGPLPGEPQEPRLFWISSDSDKAEDTQQCRSSTNVINVDHSTLPHSSSIHSIVYLQSDSAQSERSVSPFPRAVDAKDLAERLEVVFAYQRVNEVCDSDPKIVEMIKKTVNPLPKPPRIYKDLHKYGELDDSKPNIVEILENAPLQQAPRIYEDLQKNGELSELDDSECATFRPQSSAIDEGSHDSEVEGAFALDLAPRPVLVVPEPQKPLSLRFDADFKRRIDRRYRMVMRRPLPDELYVSTYTDESPEERGPRCCDKHQRIHAEKLKRSKE